MIHTWITYYYHLFSLPHYYIYNSGTHEKRFERSSELGKDVIIFFWNFLQHEEDVFPSSSMTLMILLAVFFIS